MTFFVEGIDGGTAKGKKEEDETHLNTTRTSLLNWDGGGLEYREYRGLLLDLGLGQLKLACDLGVGAIMDLHLVVQFRSLTAHILEKHLTIGI